MKKRRRRLSSHEHLLSWRIFVNEFCWVMGHISIPLNVHNPSKYLKFQFLLNCPESDTKTQNVCRQLLHQSGCLCQSAEKKTCLCFCWQSDSGEAFITAAFGYVTKQEIFKVNFNFKLLNLKFMFRDVAQPRCRVASD